MANRRETMKLTNIGPTCIYHFRGITDVCPQPSLRGGNTLARVNARCRKDAEQLQLLMVGIVDAHA
jgi:hypothetical protein